MDVKEVLLLWFKNFFDKKSASGGGVNNEIKRKKQLAEKLRKPIVRKFKERTVYSTFKGNIWGSNLADMQSLSKRNKEFRFLSCAIDIFSKYAWVVALKDKTIVNAFQKALDKSGHKPSKIWADKGSKFYNSFLKKWLNYNDIKFNTMAMYSIHNEGKSVVAEIFITGLKTKIYRYMTLISKNVNIDKLDDIVDKYNNTFRTIKLKPVDVKYNAYIDSSKEVNDKSLKFKVGYHVKIWKYKNLFPEGYTPNWFEEVLVIKKVKNKVSWTYVINDLNGKEIIGTFYENELKKTKQKEFRIEKLIEKKSDELCVKWKGSDSSFNNWIDNNDLV